MTVELHLGDCLEVMKGMPDKSVDTIITDPPYGLTFMGKDWTGVFPALRSGSKPCGLRSPARFGLLS